MCEKAFHPIPYETKGVFVTKTIDEIYQEMLTVFAQETGMRPEGTGELAVRLYALAAQVYGLYQEADWTRRQCFPQTATGEELDKHAFLRGLTRNEATRAAGTLRFSIGTAAQTDLPIPQGTVCMTAGLVAFETTQAAVLPAGALTVDVPAQAVQPGAGGNTPAGTIRTMAVAPTGVAACTNPNPFTGGRETEGDEELRARVLASYQRLPNGTNAAYYEQAATALDGVAAANVLPKNRGLGTVDIYIAANEGLPSEELLDQVQAALETKREIAVDLQVLSPEALTVNVLVSVKAKEAYLPQPVQDAVSNAIETWFDGGLLGKDLLLADLRQLIYETEGVANYRIDAPANDVAVSPGQLPVLGVLSVEELT